MRALAMTGMVTASWMPLIIAGSLMRATPPSRRMSAGTRSSAMTADAPASSAIFACSAVTTSMITPPLSISARPALTLNVASSRIRPIIRGETRVPGAALLEAERLYPIRVLLGVAAVHAVRKRLDHAQQRGVRAHVRGAVRGVVQPGLRELGALGQRRVRDRDGARLAVAGELHRAHDQRVRAAGRQADHERLGVDAPEAAERLLRRAGDELGLEVEQHQQVAQVAGEERHLVGAGDEHAPRLADRVDRGFDVAPADAACGLLHVDVVGGDRGLELALVEREQRRRVRRAVSVPRLLAGRHAAAELLARGGLKLGEALEAERLREAHDGGARGVRAPRELLGRLEGDLVEVVDDVLRDVLLRAREVLEARADIRRECLVAGGLVRGLRRGRSRALHGQARYSTAVPGVPSTRTGGRLKQRARREGRARPMRGSGGGGYVRRVRSLAVVVQRYPGIPFRNSLATGVAFSREVPRGRPQGR